MRFIVENGCESKKNHLSIHIVLVPFILYLVYNYHDHNGAQGNGIKYIYMIILSFLFQHNMMKKHTHKKCIVDITPLGIQLSTMKSFIPKDIIKDIIITEIVSLHKVHTTLFIRTYNMEIISLFPDFELSYQQCEDLWVKMNDALSKI